MLKEWSKKKKKIQPSLRDSLWGFLEHLLTLNLPLPRASPYWDNIFSVLPSRGTIGPQSLIPQLLEVAFEILNNWDQAEEEERNWRENRQARAQAKLRPQLSATHCNLRTTQGIPRKLSYLSGGKTSKA